MGKGYSEPTVELIQNNQAFPTNINTSLNGVALGATDGQALDALMASNYSWSALGASATVTYSFALSSWAYGSESYGASNVALFNNVQKAAAVQALNAWSSVANINFVENNAIGDATDIVLRQADLPNGIGGWALPYGVWNSQSSKYTATRADILISKYYSSPVQGSYGFMVIAHEIGHALGLSHPGNYNGSNGSGGVEAYDNWDGSLMSYYQGANARSLSRPTGPMIYDIAAAQKLYGANRNYNSGNTDYAIDGSARSYAVWDGAGSDTINASVISSDSTIDLREGLSNVTKIGNTNLWMAFGANIEHAIGGSGADAIYGNSLSNNLYGGSGNDNISGFEGNDLLVGEDGDDTLSSGEGDDFIYSGAGNDYAVGGTGNDIIRGGLGNDALYGGAGNDNINGGDGNDLLVGEDNNDILDSGDGDDFIYAGAGDDYAVGGDGNDTVRGGLGNDTLYGGAGNDIITSGAGNDIIYGNSGVDVFVFDGSSGSDTIFDFVSGVDKIDISGDISQIFSGIVYDNLGAHFTDASNIINVIYYGDFSLGDYLSFSDFV